ncbi:MAG: PDZ domain-containing protein [Akkermansiaceae bacterium]|nr:PDZ domain-containing protein [Akkermansiaceae bacterium]MCF7734074.1 PDZ domain-containing protein [Akkermansiaceae bacterium]
MKLPYRSLSLAVGLWACWLAPIHAAPEAPNAESAPLITGLEDLEQLDKKLVGMADQVAAATVSLVSAQGAGAGSGVIVDPDGLILSAAHVVAALSGEIIVLFSDGKRASAKALGADFERDAALLKIIEPGDYPSVELAAAEPLPTNGWCVALGHPGGFDPLRAAPLRLGRILHYGDFIITDCTVVSGDSGGPLFDIEGRVIGIHSNIGMSLGENRHVPIKVFRDGWDDLLAGKRSGSRFNQKPGDDKPEAPQPQGPSKPVIGLKLGAESADGVTLDEVAEDSLAAKAGLKMGDVVVKVAGRKVTTRKEFGEALEKGKSQPRLRLVYRRDGKMKRARIPFPRPAKAKPRPAGSDESKDELFSKLRKRAQENGGRLEMTPEEMEKLGGMAELRKRLGAIGGVPDPFFLSVMNALKTIVEKAAASTVTVLADGKDVALGTVIDTDGGILTKDSETAKGVVSVRVGDKDYPATLVKRLPAWDLALFHIQAGGLHPVTFDTAASDPVRGSLLTVSGPGSDPLGIGMVSVKSRPLGQIGFLGIEADRNSVVKGKVLVKATVKDGAAAKAGFKEGDVITAINGEPTTDAIGFTQAIIKFKPNDIVKFDVLRGDEKLTLEAKLGERPTPKMSKEFLKINKMSGPLSPKIDGFPFVLQHDIPLEPAQCGGPLLNLDGRCVGINVARAGRVKTLAIPAGKIAGLLNESRADLAAAAKATPAPDDDDDEITAEEIAEVNKALEDLQHRLKHLEKRLAPVPAQ